MEILQFCEDRFGLGLGFNAFGVEEVLGLTYPKEGSKGPNN